MITHIDEDSAISQGGPSDVSQKGAMAQSEELIRELASSDFLVIGTPMHNFTVPAALKAWIDLVVRARRTFDVTPAGKVALLRDRPVFVAVASGGRFSGERARQPDFLTPYLKAILGMIGLHDLTFFSVQGTSYGPDPVVETRPRRIRTSGSISFRGRLNLSWLTNRRLLWREASKEKQLVRQEARPDLAGYQDCGSAMADLTASASAHIGSWEASG